MRPGLRIGVGLIAAFAAGGLVFYAFDVMTRQLTLQRMSCNGDSGLAGGLVGTWCSLLVQYPNRLPIVIQVVSLAVVVIAGILYLRWSLRPFVALTEVVSRLGPSNLGYRLGWRRRRDVLGRLGNELDATMDRIAAGYDNQRRFAANASHELRTPLAVQRTLIEVSLADSLTPDQLALVTRQLLAANQRNERLVEGLLVLSEADQVPVGHTPQRLDEIARTVVDQYRTRANDAGVTLGLDAEPCQVPGEQVLLARLLTNLVQNGLAYNLEVGGRVDVTVEPSVLTVVNTGPLVAAEDVDGLFEPFRRGGGERLANPDGAGLGLTIVRAVARAHDASLTAAPGPAGGLIVRVSFPQP